MGKNNMISGVLVLVTVLIIAIVTFTVVAYISNILSAAVAFVSTDQMAKLQNCGVTIPAELFKLKADIPSVLIPGVYVGLPGMMITIAILMFVAGYYYGSGRDEHSSSSETTTTTSSPNRSVESGRYEQGSRTEKTRTQKSNSSSNDGD